jgi:hypothetical protein
MIIRFSLFPLINYQFLKLMKIFKFEWNFWTLFGETMKFGICVKIINELNERVNKTEGC